MTERQRKCARVRAIQQPPICQLALKKPSTARGVAKATLCGRDEHPPTTPLAHDVTKGVAVGVVSLSFGTHACASR